MPGCQVVGAQFVTRAAEVGWRRRRRMRRRRRRRRRVEKEKGSRMCVRILVKRV